MSGTSYPVDKQYVSVPCDFNDGGNVVPIMTREKYQKIEKMLDRASHVTIGLLNKMMAYDNLSAAQRATIKSPLETLSPADKKIVDRDITGHSLKNVMYVQEDIQSHRTGYDTPVYRVNGLLTMGQHFKGGELNATVAKLSGVAPVAAPQPMRR